jgi:hypothetical protein
LEVLQQLLDLSQLSTDAAIARRFDAIAHALLQDFSLVVTRGGAATELEILELECYLHKEGVHEDPFTHESEEGRRGGQWHFHRAPRCAAGGFRGGTRKGLDLTVGGRAAVGSPYFSPADEESSALRGGVLLRTLRRTSDSKVISGPSLLVDEILRLSGCGSLADLVSHAWAGDIAAFPPARPHMTSLHLRARARPSAAPSRLPVHRSPRVGLDLAQARTAAPTDPRAVYLARPYRYFVCPALLGARGRGQTFLGVYRACVDSARYRGGAAGGVALRRAVAGLMGISESVVERYEAAYRAGAGGGDLGAFVGAAGKGAAAAPGTYLRMMGTLYRLQMGTGQTGYVVQSVLA